MIDIEFLNQQAKCLTVDKVYFSLFIDVWPSEKWALLGEGQRA